MPEPKRMSLADETELGVRGQRLEARVLNVNYFLVKDLNKLKYNPPPPTLGILKEFSMRGDLHSKLPHEVMLPRPLLISIYVIKD